MTPEQQPPAPPVLPPVPVSSPKRPWKRSVIIGAVLCGVLLLGSCAYFAVNVGRGLSAEFQSVGDAVLGKMAHGDYNGVWEQTSPEFRKATSRQNFDGFLKGVEQGIGKPVSWKASSFNKQASVTAGGQRNDTTITYAVKHEHGSSTTVITVDKNHQLLGLKMEPGK